MAWFSRLRKKARALCRMEATKLSSARNIAQFWTPLAKNWSLNLELPVPYPSRTRRTGLGKREQNQRGRILGTHTPVVGAGPTGLNLACELTRHGAPVRIVDKLPGVLPHGAGLPVSL
jgi:hypothetical protein